MACKHKSRVWDNGWCNVSCMYCTLTQERTCKHNKQTNADRIRAMSDEELVQFINHFNICDIRTNDECKMSYCACCEVCVMDWLHQPAEDTPT